MIYIWNRFYSLAATELPLHSIKLKIWRVIVAVYEKWNLTKN